MQIKVLMKKSHLMDGQMVAGKSDAFGKKKCEMDKPSKLFPILPTQKVCLILIKNEITAAGTCKLDNFLFRNSFPNAQHKKTSLTMYAMNGVEITFSL